MLLNLAKQVQFTELPWVQAAIEADGVRRRPEDPAEVARKIATIAVEAFPGTILPNALISELSALYVAAEVDIPLTEEVAADIFMGRFSSKFTRSARLAAGLLHRTPYERYYGLDFDEVRSLPMRAAARRPGPRWWPSGHPTRAETSLEAVCLRGAPAGRRWSVVRNGMIIERQQIVTTHNLAALVSVGKVQPTRTWDDLAVEAAAQSALLLSQAQRRPRPLGLVKNAAYAWRQAVFFLSMADPETQRRIVQRIRSLPDATDWPMVEVVDGLDAAVNRTTAPSRPFLGWTVGPHWALARRNRWDDHAPG